MAASLELEHVKGVWQRMQGNSPIYDFLLSDVEIISATKGSVTSRLVLSKNHVNSRGTIHGAVSAALVDCEIPEELKISYLDYLLSRETCF